MKVIIAGGRDFNNYGLLFLECEAFLLGLGGVEIVSGGANGADKLGERFARDKGYKVTQFPADWDKFGKSAGYRRNKEMAQYADILIAFWDGMSKGTGHMIDLANFHKLKVHIINYETTNK